MALDTLRFWEDAGVIDVRQRLELRSGVSGTYHRAAAARGLAASDLNDVAQAASAMRIGWLLVEANRVIPHRDGGDVPPALRHL